jgi:hypothetical protein
MDSSTSIDPSLLMDLSGGPFDDSTPSLNFPELDDEHLFTAAWDEQDASWAEDANLYSISPSWDFVQPKVEAVTPQPIPYTTTSILTPAQQERLRNIAMPQHLDYSSTYSPTPESSTHKSNSVSSPDDNSPSRKRKSSADADDDDDDAVSGQHPVKKPAHNMIEQRYRTNLTDKIAALRDSVPSLRIMTKSARGEDTADDVEELQGLAPAHKLNKATVSYFFCHSSIPSCISWPVNPHLLRCVHDSSLFTSICLAVTKP